MQISLNKNYTLQLPSPIVQVHPFTIQMQNRKKRITHVCAYAIRELKNLIFIIYCCCVHILKDLHLIDIIKSFSFRVQSCTIKLNLSIRSRSE